MNDHELDLALADFGGIRVRETAPAELRERIQTTPLHTRAGRGWLPSFPTWRFPTMFSALKFIAAGVIVALFGGFLLAGVLTGPQGDEIAPAAVTESPSPMTSEELLSGMVTEEVEPGVFRVVNDGVRDISYSVRSDIHTVDVAPDGSVWLSGDTRKRDMFRLGEEPVYKDAAGLLPYREVAPDGSLWAIGEVSDDRGGIFSFDGEGWTVRATTTDGLSALAVGPDGTVWVAAEDRDKHCPDNEDDGCSGTVLLRLEDDGSLTTIEDWADVYDGDTYPYEVAVSPDGEVWLVGTPRYRPEWTEVLLRFDGEGWDVIPVPEGFMNVAAGRSLGFGPDGALLVNAAGGLARFDDPGWTTLTETDGIKSWGEQGFFSRDLRDVAADGSLWLLGSPTDEGSGVTHYDGTTWTSYLAESPILDLAIAPDGSLWLRAITPPDADLYVITPEAVAAAE